MKFHEVDLIYVKLNQSYQLMSQEDKQIIGQSIYLASRETGTLPQVQMTMAGKIGIKRYKMHTCLSIPLWQRM